MAALLPNTDRGRLLLLLGVAMAAFAIALTILDPGDPTVAEFEFAGSEQRAAEMMAEWGESGRDLARLSLWLDFGFMLSYGAFFTLAAIATRDFARERDLRLLGMAGVVTPIFAASAALFDAAENVALLLILGGDGGSFAPPFAAVCASLKFLLIALAIAYVLWGLLSRFAYAARGADL